MAVNTALRQARSQGGQGALPPSCPSLPPPPPSWTWGSSEKKVVKKFYVVDPDACPPPQGSSLPPQQQIPGYGPVSTMFDGFLTKWSASTVAYFGTKDEV
jgi:hypothetical protein